MCVPRQRDPDAGGGKLSCVGSICSMKATSQSGVIRPGAERRIKPWWRSCAYSVSRRRLIDSIVEGGSRRGREPMQEVTWVTEERLRSHALHGTSGTPPRPPPESRKRQGDRRSNVQVCRDRGRRVRITAIRIKRPGRGVTERPAHHVLEAFPRRDAVYMSADVAYVAA